jgi:hypothetical protein
MRELGVWGAAPSIHGCGRASDRLSTDSRPRHRSRGFAVARAPFGTPSATIVGHGDRRSLCVADVTPDEPAACIRRLSHWFDVAASAVSICWGALHLIRPAHEGSASVTLLPRHVYRVFWGTATRAGSVGATCGKRGYQSAAAGGPANLRVRHNLPESALTSLLGSRHTARGGPHVAPAIAAPSLGHETSCPHTGPQRRRR